MQTPFRVLIIGDNPLARTGLVTILSDRSECIVIGQMAPEADLLAGLDAYDPDVIVWDLSWPSSPDLSGVTAACAAGLQVVALVNDDAPVLDLWAAGVRALLAPDVTAAGIVTALKGVLQGLAILDVPLLESLLPAREPPVPLADPLTPRELQVLQLLAEGLANKAIAIRLNISEHTVKFHINAIMGKLNAQSRTEAAIQAARLGLITL
ncbi:MAG: response regulator transcription factor [Chloroflexi bacterium]|nr:response regulator transcription factor [Chloroflexota bacterium]